MVPPFPGTLTTPALGPEQLPVVWDLVLQPDPEGPALIARAARQLQAAITASFPRRRGAQLSAYLLGPAGQPEGYLLVHTENTPDAPRATLRVQDRALLTPRAYRRAVAFLAEHRSMYDHVALCGGIVEPLFVGLSNQPQRIHRREDWMLRLVDVPAALRARGYAPGIDAEVHLWVRDDVLDGGPECPDGRMVLRVRNGCAQVTAGGTGSVTVDVRGLAALYTGHMAPAEVEALGYLHGDLESAAALGTVFAGPSPWVNEII